MVIPARVRPEPVSSPPVVRRYWKQGLESVEPIRLDNDGENLLVGQSDTRGDNSLIRPDLPKHHKACRLTRVPMLD